MRHHVAGRKLGKKTPHRKAMFANMLASLIMHDAIETTLPKAKELKSLADKMVTLGKRRTLHARRRAIQIIRDKDAVKRLFDEVAKRFDNRNGGYTRIYKLGHRLGDAASMARIEYLSSKASHSAEKSNADSGKSAGKKSKAKTKTSMAKEKNKTAEKKKSVSAKKKTASKSGAKSVKKPAKNTASKSKTKKTKDSK